MKRNLTIITMLLSVFISVPVFSSQIPQVISVKESEARESMGNVSVSAVPGSSDDAIKELQKKAGSMGGSKIRIISLGTPGDSSYWMGNAEVFR